MDNDYEILKFMEQELYDKNKNSWDEVDWDTYYYLQSLGIVP